MSLRVGVVGASGYTGGEICRWLLGHPEIELVAAVSRSHAGQRLGDALPALGGCTDLVCEGFDPERLSRLDAVLVATPHGSAKPLVAALSDAPIVLDSSADHRWSAGWVYGQPEWNGAAIAGARRIAVPGCFATAIELAVAPFVAAKAVRGPVCVAAATGSTGSGAEPSQGTHHPERFVNFKAYKPLVHQHVPEIRALLATLGDVPALHFVPHSAPVDRGIFATCFVPTDVDGPALVRDAYAGRPLVRLRDGSPELRVVRGTAFADVAVHAGDGVAVVLAALDNLGKGAAAQAVQCLNLALGLPAETGLLRPGATP